MSVFVDTSAWFALASSTDQDHRAAAAIYRELAERNDELITTSYVLAETMALIQRRLGWKPLQVFAATARTVEVVWIDETRHREAEEMVLARRRRQLGIVDAVGFVVMRGLDLDTAFAFDDDFAREGFRVLAPTDR